MKRSDEIDSFECKSTAKKRIGFLSSFSFSLRMNPGFLVKFIGHTIKFNQNKELLLNLLSPSSRRWSTSEMSLLTKR